MPEAASSETSEPVPSPISLKEFFESLPPGSPCGVISIGTRVYNPNGNDFCDMHRPDLRLYCPTKGSCEGFREYGTTENKRLRTGEDQKIFVDYTCKNCGSSGKTFALWLKAEAGGGGVAYKFGEVPNFGAPTPPKLTRLLGKFEAELFLKGRACENQGHGIAAYAYYRRVIESKKDALFDEIIRVSKALGSPSAVIDSLVRAKSQVQFTNAVEQVKVALPETLLINGHNPITLLHAALSSHLHSGTDEDCLRSATDARLVLTELVKRLADAMKEDQDLKSAVNRLARHRENLANAASE